MSSYLEEVIVANKLITTLLSHIHHQLPSLLATPSGGEKKILVYLRHKYMYVYENIQTAYEVILFMKTYTLIQNDIKQKGICIHIVLPFP